MSKAEPGSREVQSGFRAPPSYSKPQNMIITELAAKLISTHQSELNTPATLCM